MQTNAERDHGAVLLVATRTCLAKQKQRHTRPTNHTAFVKSYAHRRATIDARPPRDD